MDLNWPRWIVASIMTAFKNALPNGTQLIMQNSDTESIDKSQDIFELRIDGPYTRRGTKCEYIYTYGISIMSKVHRSDADAYKFERIKGIVMAAFVDICVFKFGPNNPDPDDQSFIETLRCISRPREINIVNFIAYGFSTRMDTGTIDAQYEIRLTN